MIFCECCFKDKELSKIISTNSKKIGSCPICGQNNVHIYDTKTDYSLTPIFEELLGVLSSEKDLPESYPKDEKRSLVEEIQFRWDAFSDISDTDKLEIIKSICKDTYETSRIIFDKPVGIPEIYNQDYLKENSILKNNKWEDFTREIKTVNRYHSKMIDFNILERFFSFVRKDYRKGQIMYRARISENEKGFSPDNMSAPPAGKSSEGRANASGITCLYLANDLKTALHEVKSSLYDYVTVAEFTLKKDITVVNLRSIVEISPFIDGLGYLSYIINKEFLIKLDEEMSKPLRRNDPILEYVPTQYIVDFVKSIEHNDKNEYAGIEYKSTVCPDGYNLAIFDPELFECKKVDVYEITSLEYECRKI